MNRDRPPILTERRFDRRLAAMVLVAVLAHILVLGVLVFLGEFRLRPRAEGDAYTVEVVDGGELGGHLPAGLPDIDIGPAGRKQAARAKAAPKTAPPKPPPPAKPEPEPPQPPEVAKAEPPKAEPAKEEPKPEPKPEPAKPEVVARADQEPDDREKLIVPATPAPPTPRPTAAPTARPTAPPTAPPAPTPRPTAAPTATAAPTRHPAPTPTRAAPRATPTATAVAIAKPAPTRTGSVAFRPAATPSPRAAGPAPSPTASSREAQIAEALARVQQRVGRGEEAGEHAPSGAASGPTAPAPGSATGPAGGRGGGVGGTDAPDPSRRIGMGPGAGGSGKVRGLEFLLYYNQMIARIRGAWAWAGGKPDLIVKVRFRIQDDGSIADLRVTDSSGDSSYDASVLRAVRAVSPLAPPPAAYRNDFADVELTFQPSDLQAPG